MDAPPGRPLPDMRNAGVRFWSAAAEGFLLLPACSECGRTFWHPRPRCPHCASAHVGWIASRGTGTIHTYTVVRQNGDAFFAARVPYAVAMIDLDEGVRLMSNVVDTPLDSLRIGLRVEAMFEKVAPAIGVPVFRAAGARR